MDPAYYGNCLSCGGRTYAQSYCDWCEDEAGQVMCPECGLDYESEGPLTDCLDHVEDGDLREHVRKETQMLINRYELRMDQLRGRIGTLEAALREKEPLIREIHPGLCGLEKQLKGIRG